MEALSGRWWRKRWSRQKAEAALEQLLRLLEASALFFCLFRPSYFMLACTVKDRMP